MRQRKKKKQLSEDERDKCHKSSFEVHIETQCDCGMKSNGFVVLCM